MKARLPDGATAALAYAERTAGWNNRRADVQRFTLPNVYGHEACTLYVVPARRWAFHRWKRQVPQRRQDGSAV